MSIENVQKPIPSAAVAIAIILEKALVRGLAEAGFKRIGKHLVRRAKGVIHIIHFRAYSGQASPVGTFILTPGITSEVLHEALFGKPLPRNPATAMFALGESVGRLMGLRMPPTWDARNVEEIDELTDHVVEVIQSKVLPFLDKYPNAEALLERLRRHDIPHDPLHYGQLLRAVLAKSVGLDAEALEAINIAYKNAPLQGMRSRVLAVAQKLQLHFEMPGGDQSA